MKELMNTSGRLSLLLNKIWQEISSEASQENTSTIKVSKKNYTNVSTLFKVTNRNFITI